MLTVDSIDQEWIKREWVSVNEEAVREKLFRSILLVSSDIDQRKIPDELRPSARIEIPKDAPLSDLAPMATELLSSPVRQRRGLPDGMTFM